MTGILIKAFVFYALYRILRSFLVDGQNKKMTRHAGEKQQTRCREKDSMNQSDVFEAEYRVVDDKSK